MMEIHDTQTCDCEMCKWADEQERQRSEELANLAAQDKEELIEMAERNGE